MLSMEGEKLAKWGAHQARVLEAIRKSALPNRCGMETSNLKRVSRRQELEEVFQYRLSSDSA
jgi:hypothetical protein